MLSREATKQLASSVVTGDEQGYSDFMTLCLRTQSTMELNHKLTKIMPRRHSLRILTHRKSIYARNLGLKRWEDILLKGGEFLEAYIWYYPSFSAASQK